MIDCWRCGYSGPRVLCTICAGRTRSPACAANSCPRCGAFVSDTLPLMRVVLFVVGSVVAIIAVLVFCSLTGCGHRLSVAGAGGHPQTLPQAGVGERARR